MLLDQNIFFDKLSDPDFVRNGNPGITLTNVIYMKLSMYT